MVKISVIIPAFNDEKFLGNCLLSLKEQDFKDFKKFKEDIDFAKKQELI
jgi:glycosyltransferase involved in cell wall biosynthesis